jgi:hypothetical protein
LRIKNIPLNVFLGHFSGRPTFETFAGIVSFIASQKESDIIIL